MPNAPPKLLEFATHIHTLYLLFKLQIIALITKFFEVLQGPPLVEDEEDDDHQEHELDETIDTTHVHFATELATYTQSPGTSLSNVSTPRSEGDDELCAYEKEQKIITDVCPDANMVY